LEIHPTAAVPKTYFVLLIWSGTPFAAPVENMQTTPYRSYRKLRQRRLLVISAGGESSGIQGLYFIRHDDTWEIIANSFFPYGETVGALIESSRITPIALSDFAWLETRITHLCAECAKTVMAQVPRGLKKPHLIILNELSLYRGPTGENVPYPSWNVGVGDPQHLATAIQTPVISDISRFHILAGGKGSVPTVAGDLVMAKRYGSPVGFLNIGLIARLTIVDTRSPQRCILDSDTGPGMCLINRIAREINCPDGFDRDGSQAASGTVHAACLESLATSPWFLKEGPKETTPDQFNSLLFKADLGSLSPLDRLATVTALTARTVYDFFRRSTTERDTPQSIVVSGGGANNRALHNYLATYFGHIPIVGCEKLAIPPEMRVPLATGLSIDSYLQGTATVWEDGMLPKAGMLGRISNP
jgi:anhydro-N-acetylmuramic acid kinase